VGLLFKISLSQKLIVDAGWVEADTFLRLTSS
jgi:hypothetical protein